MNAPNNKKNLADFFLPNLCHSRALVILLAVSEALVLAITLIESGLLEFSWERFTVMSFFVQWVCLLSAALICPQRAWLLRWRVLWVSIWSVCIVALVTMLVSLISDWLWSGSAWPFGRRGVDWWWIGRNVIISVIFAAMGMRYFYVQSQWRYQAKAELSARLAALQANIRPHFFFNTLNTVASLISHKPEQAEQMLLDLADLFRAVLKNEHHWLPLAEEIQLGKSYLAIEQARLGEERLRIEWQLPNALLEFPELPTLKVPPLLLQPLLENAVYHGIQPRIEGGFIHIRVTVEGTLCRITVCNSKPEQQAHSGLQVAHKNIRARLQVMGPQAKLLIEDTQEDYCASLVLPLVPEEK